MSKRFIFDTTIEPYDDGAITARVTTLETNITSLGERIKNIDGLEVPNPLYVSPDGNDDTGDGTEANPFRQIQTAIDRIPPNKKYNIYISAGEYNFVYIANRKKVNFYLNRYLNNSDIIIKNETPLTSSMDDESDYIGCINVCENSSLAIYDLNNVGTVRLVVTGKNIRVSDSSYFYSDKNILHKATTNSIVNSIVNSAYVGGNFISVQNNSTLTMRSGFYVMENTDIKYRNMIYCDTGSSIFIYSNSVSTNSLDNVVSDSSCFVLAELANTVNIAIPSLVIPNKFSSGFVANSSTIHAKFSANNAVTKTQQLNNGRVFVS